MKILYDYQAFTMQYFGGVSKCFCELISNFPTDINYEIALKYSNNKHLANSKLKQDLQPVIIDRQSFISKYKIKGAHKLFDYLNLFHLIQSAERLNQNVSINALIRQDFDVFHPTFFNPYFLKYIGKKPFVLTVHDMIPEIFPEYFKKPNPETTLKKLLCDKATAIVTVSNNTKEDLIRFMHIPQNKIQVIYHGSPKVNIHTHSKRIITEPYFLYVGQRNYYKNFKQTLYDFANFSTKYPQYKLVCTGHSFTIEELDLIKKLMIQDNVIHIAPDDIQMTNLYSNAAAFIYPSLYEGFGMPILEAFSAGCIALLNDKSCFKEIGGNAALYFNSDSNGSNLCSKMEMIVKLDNEKRSALINLGIKRSEMFSWKQSSIQLMKLYNSII